MDNLSDRQRKLLEAIESIETSPHAKSTEPAPADKETADCELRKDIEVYRKIEGLFEKIRRPGDMPEKIGRFKIKKWLGSGTFGAVYLAEDPTLGDVAIKIPHDGRYVSDEDQDRFLREAANTRKLEHPRIVPIYEYSLDDDGTPYIVLQYLPESLEARLEENVYSAKDAAVLMAHVAAAMQHAHSETFYHRDLKPANILLDSNDIPKVVDFGLAVTRETQIGMAGQFAGTPAYMSPEQIRGEVDCLDARTDIWAMGVILYQMVTGEHPFWRGDVEDCKKQILKYDPRPVRQINREIPVDFQKIIERCLAKAPCDRYDNADDLREELTEYDIRDIPRDQNLVFYRQRVMKHLKRRGLMQYKPRVLDDLEFPLDAGPALSDSGMAMLESEADDSGKVKSTNDSGKVKSTDDSKGCRVVISIGFVVLLILGSLWWLGLSDRPMADLPGPVVAASNLIFTQPSPTIELDAQFTTNEGKHWQELKNGSTLSRRDWYRLRFRAKDRAYFYVWQYDTQGNVCWLYPHNGQCDVSEGENPFPADTWIQLPADDVALHLDDAVGLEQIFVVATPERAGDLKSALAQHAATPTGNIQAPFAAALRGVGGKVKITEPGSNDTRWINKIEGERGVVFQSIWFKHVE